MKRQRHNRRAPRNTARPGRLLFWLLAAILFSAVLGVACVTCVPTARPTPPGPHRSLLDPRPARTPSRQPAQPGPAPRAAIAGSVHLQLGVPADGDPSDDYLMDKGAYVVSYNPVRNVPNWVSWKLDQTFLGHLPRHDRFMQDKALPPGIARIAPDDYAHSGYDRGHLCPSADRTDGLDHNAATFLMTNMQPQLHELNAGPWKDLEEHERALARTGKVLFIVAGGVFGSPLRTIGKAKIAVPHASYKLMVILEPGQRARDVNPTTPVLAAIMPNEHGVSRRPWREYAVSIDQIEHATGYDFLSEVAPAVQQVLESRVAEP